jgi:hypothetical protein
MWTDDIRWLTRYEFKRNMLSLLGTLCFFVFYALLLGVMFTDMSEDSPFYSLTLDAFFLAVLPGFGILLKRVYFTSYWSSDIFTKRLKFWRQLPIGIPEIVWSRYFHLLLCTCIQAPIFFTLFYLVSQYQETYIHWFNYLTFAYAWTVFSIICSMIYMYMELCLSGKRYFIYSLLSVFPILLIIIVLNALQIPIVITSINFTAYGYGLPMILTSTILLVAIWGIIPSLTIKRLSRRDW